MNVRAKSLVFTGVCGGAIIAVPRGYPDTRQRLANIGARWIVAGGAHRNFDLVPDKEELMGKDEKRWFTLEEVCEVIGVTRSTFDKWRAKGAAPRMLRLPNGSLRIEVEDLNAWLAALPEAA